MGAPFGFSFYDFPMAESFHALIIQIIGIFTKDVALVTNLFYILGYVLSACTALFVFRQRHLPTFPAIGMSLLFAFLPHHYRRGEQHLFLSAYYLIPLVVLVLLWLANGEPVLVRSARSKLGFTLTRKGLASIVISVLLGSGGVYYAFFSAFFLGVIALSCVIHRRKLSAAIPAAVVTGVLVLSLLINLAPSMMYHRQHGYNTEVAARSPAEVEFFSLRIADLLLPISGHRIPFLASVKSMATAPPPVPEGTTMASLGVIGSIGFLSLLAIAMYHPFARDSRDLQALSALNLAALLLATIGSAGSLFALIVSSKIRAYSRISVFIAFFAFLALLILIDKLGVTRLNSVLARRTYSTVIGGVLLAGLWDLTPVRPPLTTESFTYKSDRGFIESIESLVPRGALVFQLPYMSFPEASPINQLEGYDHFRGYLYSHHLRWSFGVMAGRDADIWECNTAGMPFPEMFAAIRKAGFKGIYVDRFGFSDNGAYVCDRLSQLLRQVPLQSANGRLAFFILP